MSLSNDFPPFALRLRHLMCLLFPVTVVVAAACSVTDIVGEPGSSSDKTGTISPDAVKTPEGALQFFNGVMAVSGGAFFGAMTESGIFTDELRRPISAAFSITHRVDATDGRRSIEGTDGTDGPITLSFGALQLVRANARQGRTLLTTYAPAASPALTGRLYVLEGYADVALADLYCSGIPLSTVNPDGTFTLAAGSTTEEVYRTALALFDSALALSTDSARFTQMAHVGSARAHLALGEYAQAGTAAAAVPDSFVDAVAARFVIDNGGINIPSVVSDSEGHNGFAYATSRDPRSAVDSLPGLSLLFPAYIPLKYPMNVPTGMVLASGVEARLVQAEVALRAGDASWLSALNTLRTTGVYTGITTNTVGTTTYTDTLWVAGTGGVGGLGPLRDPGAGPLPAGTTPLRARLDLVFRERAFGSSSPDIARETSVAACATTTCPNRKSIRPDRIPAAAPTDPM